ncbi:hypothetical protein, partial [Pseudomonas sp. CCI2.4]|uniref:SWIM zinc finger family protein n=1 Tax=Pseudomonas sp. CCI2.4 TaxID=3048617 RepID=UPI002B23A100
MSSILEKVIASSLAQVFKAQSLERGRDYDQQQRIKLQHLSPELVRTVCKGSGLEIYTQTLTLKDPAEHKQFVAFKCTCPVRNNCKH